MESEQPPRADTLEGFTEPWERVEVAAPESGIIQEFRVREGQSLRTGEVIAVLDNGVLHAAMAAAQAKAAAHGSLDAATASLKLRRNRLQQMQALLQQEHASPEEVERAATDVEMAEAELTRAREESHEHALAVSQIEAQIERRTIRSPIDGVLLEQSEASGRVRLLG